MQVIREAISKVILNDGTVYEVGDFVEVEGFIMGIYEKEGGIELNMSLEDSCWVTYVYDTK